MGVILHTHRIRGESHIQRKVHRELHQYTQIRAWSFVKLPNIKP